MGRLCRSLKEIEDAWLARKPHRLVALLNIGLLRRSWPRFARSCSAFSAAPGSPPSLPQPGTAPLSPLASHSPRHLDTMNCPNA